MEGGVAAGGSSHNMHVYGLGFGVRVLYMVQSYM